LTIEQQFIVLYFEQQGLLIFWQIRMFNELDLKQLWKELDEYSTELEKESKVLQEVWLKIAQLKTTNEEEMEK
jgi:hypothetical protein